MKRRVASFLAGALLFASSARAQGAASPTPTDPPQTAAKTDAEGQAAEEQAAADGAVQGVTGAGAKDEARWTAFGVLALVATVMAVTAGAALLASYRPPCDASLGCTTPP